MASPESYELQYSLLSTILAKDDPPSTKLEKTVCFKMILGTFKCFSLYFFFKKKDQHLDGFFLTILADYLFAFWGPFEDPLSSDIVSASEIMGSC